MNTIFLFLEQVRTYMLKALNWRNEEGESLGDEGIMRFLKDKYPFKNFRLDAYGSFTFEHPLLGDVTFLNAYGDSDAWDTDEALESFTECRMCILINGYAYVVCTRHTFFLKSKEKIENVLVGKRAFYVREYGDTNYISLRGFNPLSKGWLEEGSEKWVSGPRTLFELEKMEE